MKLLYGSQSRVGQRAATLIVDRLNGAIGTRGVALFGISGGRSTPFILEALVAASVEWERVHIFLVDERCVPIGDPRSNYDAVMQPFIELLAKRSSQTVRETMRQVHPFVYDEDRLDMGLSRYRLIFNKVRALRNDASGVEGFDVALLGVGEDGHVASLFPNHPSVRIEAPEYIAVFDAPKPPPIRISISRRLLTASGMAMLLFMGPGKRDALNAFIERRLPPEGCPALLAAAAGETVVVTDQESAKQANTDLFDSYTTALLTD